jgi:hypothetical protein
MDASACRSEATAVEPVLDFRLNFRRSRERIPFLVFWRRSVVVAEPPTITSDFFNLLSMLMANSNACRAFLSVRKSGLTQLRHTFYRKCFSREAVA